LAKNTEKKVYYYKILFDDSAKDNIYKAIRDEKAVKKEICEYEMCREALEYLQKENIENTEIVNNIMKETLETRGKNNENLINLSKIVQELRKSGKSFDEEQFNRVYPLYIEILKLNFLSIKNIAQGVKYYDNIQKAANKKRRSMAVRFNRKLVEPFDKLDYQLSYYKMLLRTYESVINMSMAQYMNFIEKKE